MSTPKHPGLRYAMRLARVRARMELGIERLPIWHRGNFRDTWFDKCRSVVAKHYKEVKAEDLPINR